MTQVEIKASRALEGVYSECLELGQRSWGGASDENEFDSFSTLTGRKPTIAMIIRSAATSQSKV